MRGKYVSRLFKRSKRNLVICVSTFAICWLVLWSGIFEPIEQDEISCNYLHSSSSFPVLGRQTELPARSIFFLATSCPGNVTSREYCAVESAARANPEWQVNVVFTRPVSVIKVSEEKYRNVKFWSIRIEEFFNGSPFEELYKGYVFHRCRLSVKSIRNVLKYLILRYWGGIYLDLDVIVARSLGSLVRNWATRENDDTIGEGILAFSRDAVGRNLSEIAIRKLFSSLHRGDCRRKSLTVLANSLSSFCSTPDVASMSSATCDGFEVYGPQFFHPIPESSASDYFIPKDLGTNNAYTYHFWDHITKGYKVSRNSPIAKLARRYCPLTLKLFYKKFGYKFENSE